MAMRCLGRAGFFAAAFAGVARAFVVTALRAVGRVAALVPLHFFFTADCAALRDAGFFLDLAMNVLPLLLWREASTDPDIRGWAKRSGPTSRHDDRSQFSL